MELGDPPPDGSIVTLRRSLLAAGGDRQHPTCQDQHRTDCEEFEVPAQRPAEIVADVVDAEDLVVDALGVHVAEVALGVCLALGVGERVLAFGPVFDRSEELVAATDDLGGVSAAIGGDRVSRDYLPQGAMSWPRSAAANSSWACSSSGARSKAISSPSLADGTRRRWSACKKTAEHCAPPPRLQDR